MQRAKIFLAEERDVTETESFRRYNTFNFERRYNEYKTPVEKLYVCNDDTLAGGKRFSLTAEAATQLILLPVVGAVEFVKNSEAVLLINAGEVFTAALNRGDVFEIINPYKRELVNFLQFWLYADAPNENTSQLYTFNIDDSKNSLVQLPLVQAAYIAKLGGRKEITCTPIKENSCVFAFAIQGAFETEGILMHPRDGAAFWNYKQIAMEALSNDAIIFLLEVKS